MKKNIVIVICILVIMMQSIPAFAYDYPSNFGTINTKYENAINSNDYSKIVEYVNQIINLMQNAPDGPEKRNILVTRYNQIGLSYAALKDYDNAARAFQILYGYLSQFGNEFYDYVKASKARMLQYTSEIKLYTDGGQSPY